MTSRKRKQRSRPLLQMTKQFIQQAITTTIVPQQQQQEFQQQSSNVPVVSSSVRKTRTTQLSVVDSVNISENKKEENKNKNEQQHDIINNNDSIINDINNNDNDSINDSDNDSINDITNTSVSLSLLYKMKSRKRARQVTTIFHKLTKEREELMTNSNSNNEDKQQNQNRLTEIDKQIQLLGGRPMYQRASQISTSYYSTSKWILGYLSSHNGWLYGRTYRCLNDIDDTNDTTSCIGTSTTTNSSSSIANEPTTASNNSYKKYKKKNCIRTTTRILEIGAINTELLDAADLTISSSSSLSTNTETIVTSTTAENTTGSTSATKTTTKKKYNIYVDAIDIHSMYPGRIQEQDFLTMSIPKDNTVILYYDVIVCSMVLNCVTIPEQRGSMLQKMYHFLNPNGICFLILPKLCLTLSCYLNEIYFNKLLSDVIGFTIVSHTKTSPKLLYYILQKPDTDNTTTNIINKDGQAMKKQQQQQQQQGKSTTLATSATSAEKSLSDSMKNGPSNKKLQQQQPWYTKLTKIQRGKKYRNTFAVIVKK